MSRIAVLLLATVSASTCLAQTSGLHTDEAGIWSSSPWTRKISRSFSYWLPFPSEVNEPEVCREGSEMVISRSMSYPAVQFAAICKFRSGHVAVSGIVDDDVDGSRADVAFMDTEGRRVRASRQGKILWASVPIDSITAQVIGDLWERSIRTAIIPDRFSLSSTDGEAAFFRRGSQWLAGGRGTATITATATNPHISTIAGAMKTLALNIGAVARGEATPDELAADMERLGVRLDAYRP